MENEDYYSILGVSRDCSALVARKAYRRLVLQFHPDRNPGDAAAEEQFKKIVLAYGVISDEKKRAEYDRLSGFAEAFAQSRRRAEASSKASDFGSVRSRPPGKARGSYAEAQAELKKAMAEARKRKRASPEDALFYVESNELERRDLIRGIIYGACFVTFMTGTQANRGTGILDLKGLALWSALPLGAGPMGYRIGVIVETWLDIAIFEGSLPVSWESLGKLLPAFSTLGLCWAAVYCSNYFGLSVMTRAVVPAGLAAGLSAACGSAFGRAFTSVAETFPAKLIGVGVGTIVGAIFGTALGLVLLTLVGGLSGDSAFFDLLFSGSAAAALGGTLASATGSLRTKSE